MMTGALTDVSLASESKPRSESAKQPRDKSSSLVSRGFFDRLSRNLRKR